MAALVLPVARAPSVAAEPTASRQADRPAGGLWFDPTQLPSFTGTVERFLVDPRGGTDGLLFREGPQVVFPPDIGAAVRRVAAEGRPLTVWGIRIRNAPVITILAFSAGADSPPVLVERLYRRVPERPDAAPMRELSVEGRVKAPYYTPQGEVTGAILEDGTSVLLPAGAAERFRDLLTPGATLAAEGPGYAGQEGRAVLARRIGAEPGSLRPTASATP
ncbi:hypothetical protein M0638_19110 [Roseomonas sp. NAR14]|uniref:Uncharacterized protein n=1 Tax=Roseomonas acroporae TaxID=2937791 RepID=A0A9X1Y9P9_9PROT|nr:hypothetical protein [Roseomonas acroporae]MCK8786489.1 hypothetical protein [Roseomonas acroporae]